MPNQERDQQLQGGIPITIMLILENNLNKLNLISQGHLVVVEGEVVSAPAKDPDPHPDSKI